MGFSPKATDRFSFGVLYVLVASLVLWAGLGFVNRGFELRFLKDYLVQWEIGLRAFTAQQGKWPEFSGTNHVDYMESLVHRMTTAGVALPDSNTSIAYRYHMERFGYEDEDIFILCLNNQIVLYGISGKTLGQLDKVVDRYIDLERGLVSGRPGKNPNTYIGMWQL